MTATLPACPPQAQRHKLASTESVLADVRRIVSRAADTWGVGITTTEAAVLVTVEIVTNAVQHAPGKPIFLRLAIVKAGFRIEVHDLSKKRPRRREPDLTMPTQPVPDDEPDPHGWGMGIVECLSEAHGVKKEHGGKTVWAVLAIPVVSV